MQSGTETLDNIIFVDVEKEYAKTKKNHKQNYYFYTSTHETVDLFLAFPHLMSISHRQSTTIVIAARAFKPVKAIDKLFEPNCLKNFFQLKTIYV